jgi:hypothetical protein
MDEKFVETLTLRLRKSGRERERERPGGGVWVESARERGREGRQGGSPGRPRVRNCGIFGGELCNREVVSTLVVIGELENYGELELNLEHRLLVVLGGLFLSWREMWSYGSSVSSQWRYSLGSWYTRYTCLCFCLIPSLKYLDHSSFELVAVASSFWLILFFRLFL